METHSWDVSSVRILDAGDSGAVEVEASLLQVEKGRWIKQSVDPAMNLGRKRDRGGQAKGAFFFLAVHLFPVTLYLLTVLLSLHHC